MQARRTLPANAPFGQERAPCRRGTPSLGGRSPEGGPSPAWTTAVLPKNGKKKKEFCFHFCPKFGCSASPHSPPCSQEKALLDEVKALAKKREELQIRLEQAQNRMDLAMVADIKYGEGHTVGRGRMGRAGSLLLGVGARGAVLVRARQPALGSVAARGWAACVPGNLYRARCLVPASKGRGRGVLAGLTTPQLVPRGPPRSLSPRSLFPPTHTAHPTPACAGALAEVEELIKRKQAEAKRTDRMLSDTVGPEEIAAVVSKWTGIPVTKLQASRAWGEGLHGLQVAATPSRGMAPGAVLPSLHPCCACLCLPRGRCPHPPRMHTASACPRSDVAPGLAPTSGYLPAMQPCPQCLACRARWRFCPSPPTPTPAGL